MYLLIRSIIFKYTFNNTKNFLVNTNYPFYLCYVIGNFFVYNNSFFFKNYILSSFFKRFFLFNNFFINLAFFKNFTINKLVKFPILKFLKKRFKFFSNNTELQKSDFFFLNYLNFFHFFLNKNKLTLINSNFKKKDFYFFFLIDLKYFEKRVARLKLSKNTLLNEKKIWINLNKDLIFFKKTNFYSVNTIHFFNIFKTNLILLLTANVNFFTFTNKFVYEFSKNFKNHPYFNLIFEFIKFFDTNFCNFCNFFYFDLLSEIFFNKLSENFDLFNFSKKNDFLIFLIFFFKKNYNFCKYSFEEGFYETFKKNKNEFFMYLFDKDINLINFDKTPHFSYWLNSLYDLNFFKDFFFLKLNTNEFFFSVFGEEIFDFVNLHYFLEKKDIYLFFLENFNIFFKDFDSYANSLVENDFDLNIFDGVFFVDNIHINNDATFTDFNSYFNFNYTVYQKGEKGIFNTDLNALEFLNENELLENPLKDLLVNKLGDVTIMDLDNITAEDLDSITAVCGIPEIELIHDAVVTENYETEYLFTTRLVEVGLIDFDFISTVLTRFYYYKDFKKLTLYDYGDIFFCKHLIFFNKYITPYKNKTRKKSNRLKLKIKFPKFKRSKLKFKKLYKLILKNLFCIYHVFNLNDFIKNVNSTYGFLSINFFFIIMNSIFVENQLIDFEKKNFELTTSIPIDDIQRRLSTVTKANDYHMYNNHLPILTSDSHIKYKFFEAFVQTPGLQLNKFQQMYVISFFEFLFNKKFFVRYESNFVRKYKPEFIAFQFINRYKNFDLRISRYLHMTELLEIVWYSFQFKDLRLFNNWLKRMMPTFKLKHHKKLISGIKLILESHDVFFKSFLGINGFFFKVKGKLSITGNAKKRNAIVKFGSVSLSSKHIKLDYEEGEINTKVGVLGYKMFLSYK